MRLWTSSLKQLWLVALLYAWLGRGTALLCYCTYGRHCDMEKNTCWTKDTAACMTFVYQHSGTEHKTYLCSESGLECPHEGYPVDISKGSGTLCCRNDFCNRDGSASPSTRVSTTPAIATPDKQLSPPRSEGKIRCDCSFGASSGCRPDKGNRGKSHCTIENGWCITVATRILQLPGSNIRYTRYCTNEQAVCEAGKNRQTSVKCCSNAKFCNENLTPTFESENYSVGDVYTTLPPVSDSQAIPATEGSGSDPNQQVADTIEKVWCHCNNLQQCNTSYPFCQTAGKCQETPGLLPFETDQRCVEPKNDYLCTGSTPCCKGHCCNGQSTCTPAKSSTNIAPVPAVVTSPEPPKHTCHCSNCLNHECATKFGCIVDVDLTTNTSTQDCLRSSTGKQIHCSPSFALSTSHALAREVGKIKSYCCQGDKCNSIHPDHPHVLAVRKLVCRCKGEFCTEDSGLCTTTLHGGYCYQGRDGKGCIPPGAKELTTRLCRGDRAHCCNRSFCNDIDIPIVTGGGVGASTVQIKTTEGQAATEETGHNVVNTTMEFSVLYIGVPIAVFFFVCIVVLIGLILYHRRTKEINRQHKEIATTKALTKKQMFGGSGAGAMQRPTSLPKSTFDTSPVMTKLSLWQHGQEKEAPADTEQTLPTPAEQHSLMVDKGNSRSVSTSNSSISEATAVTSLTVTTPDEYHMRSPSDGITALPQPTPSDCLT